MEFTLIFGLFILFLPINSLKEECPSNNLIHEKLIDLQGIRIVESVHLINLDGKNDFIKVFAGRRHPICNPRLHGYVMCSPGRNRTEFNCHNGLYSKILIQFDRSTVNVRVVSRPMPPRNSSKEETDVENYLEQKNEWINRIRFDMKAISVVLHKWPGVLQLFGETVFPMITVNTKIVAAGGRYGKGRFIVITEEDKQGFMENNVNLVSHMAWWVSRGEHHTLSDKSEIENESPLAITIDNHTDKKKIQMIRETLLKGGAIVMFFNPYNYDVTYGGLEESVIYTFLLSLGVLASKDYAYVRTTQMLEIDWASLMSFVSPKLNLKLMAQSIDRLESDLENFLSVAPKASGILDEELKLLFKNFMPMLEDATACKAMPQGDVSKKNLLIAFSKLYNSALLKSLKFKAPDVVDFPGDILSSSATKEVTIRVKCQEAYEVIPTGYYLPPGESLIARQLYKRGSFVQWKPWINYNFFQVFDHDLFNKFPDYTVGSSSWIIDEVELYSGFGGLVWFQCLYANSEFTVNMKNVIAAATLDVRVPESVAQWQHHLDTLSAPWLTVSGDSVTFVIPTHSAKHSPSLLAALSEYDICIKNQVFMVGQNSTGKAREIIASDVQIRAGWMHAGYPIGLFLEVAEPNYSHFILNATVLRSEGMWGLFHELGHNRQSQLWTWPETKEVTNNILSALCDQIVANKSVWSANNSWLDFENWQFDLLKPYLENQYPFYNSKWGDNVWATFAIYAQMQGHFGWKFYEKVFRNYEELNQSDKEFLLSNNSAKLDFWFEQVSRVSRYNLYPLFKLWRVPVSLKALKLVQDLPEFFPDDFMTRSVPEVTKQILHQFPNAVRKAPFVRDVIPPLKNASQIRGLPQSFILSEIETGNVVHPEKIACIPRGTRDQ